MWITPPARSIRAFFLQMYGSTDLERSVFTGLPVEVYPPGAVDRLEHIFYLIHRFLDDFYISFESEKHPPYMGVQHLQTMNQKRLEMEGYPHRLAVIHSF